MNLCWCRLVRRSTATWTRLRWGRWRRPSQRRQSGTTGQSSPPPPVVTRNKSALLLNRNYCVRTVPVPTVDKLRFRFRLLTSSGSGSVSRPLQGKNAGSGTVTYFGPGSAKVRNLITVPVPLRQKVTVPVPQHCKLGTFLLCCYGTLIISSLRRL